MPREGSREAEILKVKIVEGRISLLETAEEGRDKAPGVSGGSGGDRAGVAWDFGSGGSAPGYFQTVEVLRVEPGFGVGVEVAGETQGGVCGDAAALVDNFRDASGGDVEIERLGVKSPGGELLGTTAERENAIKLRR